MNINVVKKLYSVKGKYFDQITSATLEKVGVELQSIQNEQFGIVFRHFSPIYYILFLFSKFLFNAIFWLLT